MKKYFRLAAIAVVAMALTVACKNNTTEEPADTMPIVEDTMETVDSLAEEVAEEVADIVEPVKKAAQTTAKKADEKLQETKAAAQNPTDNAKGRLAKKEADKSGITEAAPASKEAPAANHQQNTENRLKKR